MKILVLGDIHWLNVWKKLIEEHKPDKTIFLWDYVDSFIAPDSDIFNNLNEIIDYKKAHKEDVVLLLWNHDISYIYEWHWCSGNRTSMKPILKLIFSDNLSLFKICHQEWKYLFSHAWFTEKWEDYVFDNIDVFWITEYEDYNRLLQTHNREMLFMCWASRWWRDECSWPLWTDKKELEEEPTYMFLTQVVGHTHVNTIEYIEWVIFCDNLEYGDWIPLILNIDK